MGINVPVYLAIRCATWINSAKDKGGIPYYYVDEKDSYPKI